MPELPRMRKPDRVLFATSVGFSSSTRGWLGRTPDRRVLFSSIRPVWELSRPGRAAFSYFAEFVPVAMVTRNPTELLPLSVCAREHPEWSEGGTVPETEYLEKCGIAPRSSYGAGVTPLGFGGRFSSSGGMSFVTEVSAGIIVFDKRTPYPSTTTFNYNVALGGALEIPAANRSFLSIGYRFHHLSNGGAGEFNPGIAAHTLQLGWGRRAGARERN